MSSSEPATEKAKNDRALRFYRDVLGLERLHYGMWLPDDPLTMEALQAAQKRYEDFLIEKVPEGVRVDSGCGMRYWRALLESQEEGLFSRRPFPGY